MSGPITPGEVTAAKAKALPDVVFDVFNKLIAKAWDGRRAVVRQSDAVDALRDTSLLDHQQLYDDHLLDVEPVYRDAGWDVSYEKPGFNETGGAFFTFSQPPPRKD